MVDSYMHWASSSYFYLVKLLASAVHSEKMYAKQNVSSCLPVTVSRWEVGLGMYQMMMALFLEQFLQGW